MSQNAQTVRFLELYNLLLRDGTVRSAAELGRSLGYAHPSQSMGNIISGGRNVSSDTLRALYKVYHVNPAYIESGTLPKFLSDGPTPPRPGNTKRLALPLHGALSDYADHTNISAIGVRTLSVVLPLIQVAGGLQTFALRHSLSKEAMQWLGNPEGEPHPSLPKLMLESYGVNALYLITGEGGPYSTAQTALAGGNTSRLPSLAPNVLTVVVERDNPDRDNILFVSERAAAGYATGYADATYVEGLPMGRLPGFEGKSYQAFPVIGDSMFDSLHPGDIVVCSYVAEPLHAVSDLVYVVVSEDGVVVKRVVNRLSKTGQLVLKSDNKRLYPSYTLPGEKLRQLWKVECKISRYISSPTHYEKRLGEVELAMETVLKKLGLGWEEVK